LSFIDKYNSGAWRIESLLGEGSYGKVYKISKEEFGHKSYAALKVIPVPHSSSELSQLMSEGLAGDSLNSCISAMAEDITREIRFVQEFQGSANIVSCEDYEVVAKEDEPGYNILIRMELLESLEKLLPTRSFGEDDAIAVGVDICQALKPLAKNGSVHRDVKPENIFFKHGCYKLGDFSIARQINSASSMSMRGTLNYMAPEVFKRLEFGTAADLYSLGLVQYQILNNGRMPFVPAQVAPLTQSERDKLFERRMSGEPLPPPVLASPDLTKVILKACAFDCEDRFKTASEMRMSLEACKASKIVLPAESKPVPESTPAPEPELKPAPKPLPAYGVPKYAKSKKIPLFGMALAIFIVFAIIVLPRINGSSANANVDGTPLPTAKTAIASPTSTPSISPVPSAKPSDPAATSSPSLPQKEYVEIKGEQYSTTINSIELYHKQLTDADLSDLQFLTSLIEIELSDNSITDLKPFSGLINLSSLHLSNNEISDLTPISTLNNLTELDIDNNPVSDISPIFALSNLTRLGLTSMHNITDFSFISKFSSLKYLFINENDIRDIHFLSELTNMETLYLIANQIEDISYVSNLINLYDLQLAENQIADISPLSNLTNLAWLNLMNNQITDISPLSHLSNLTGLFLGDNQIEDVSCLANLTNLTYLHLSGNPISQPQLNALKSALPNCEIEF
jgi:Leucine-rich repeat (LRR) protein